MISSPLKMIKCATAKPYGIVCSRWLADFPVFKEQEIHTICPACGTSWHIHQDTTGLITMQPIKKTGKEYDDDGLRIVLREDKS